MIHGHRYIDDTYSFLLRTLCQNEIYEHIERRRERKGGKDESKGEKEIHVHIYIEDFINHFVCVCVSVYTCVWSRPMHISLDHEGQFVRNQFSPCNM